MGAPHLTALTLTRWGASEAAAAAIGASLARFPELDSLTLTPKEGPAGPVSGYHLSAALLESAAPHPRLRRLHTGNAWRDDEESLKNVVYHAKKVPELQQLVMTEGRIRHGRGFDTVATYGSEDPPLPWLQLLCIHSIVDEAADSSGNEWDTLDEDEKEDRCCEALEAVWPDLEVQILHSRAEEGY